VKKTLSCLVAVFLLSLFLCSEGFAQDENIIDVSFEIITGSRIADYYVGDFFYYNISLTNIGNTSFSTTFTVEVLNSTYQTLNVIRNYYVEMLPNETAFLLPNTTRSGFDDIYNVYHMETPGTYYVKLSSETPITYFRFFENNAYYFEYNEIRFSFNVMPSYEKIQNERWSEFLTKNEEYMEEVERYIQESKNSSLQTRNLAYTSIFIATISVCLSILRILWTVDEEQKKDRFGLYLVTFSFIILALFFLCWMISIVFF
jgi:hypothetical protein